MTAMQIFWIICSGIMVLVGAFILIRAFFLNKKSKTPPPQEPVAIQKSDLTIKINFPSGSVVNTDVEAEQLKQDLDLVVKSEQTMPNREENLSIHSTNIEQNNRDFDHHQHQSAYYASDDSSFSQPVSSNAIITPEQSQAVFYPQTVKQSTIDDSRYTILAQEQDDALSLLANATETITPVVHTYDEKKLKIQSAEANSQRLDSHLQSQIDQEQNNPLNHAERNITVTLIPSESFARISGKDVLALAEKYGLKYGAMKMFHRYEHKDGTGILWFSVMMVSDNGIESFDLNLLPNQSINGLALFLPLPHPDPLSGFEGMITLARLMATDLKATIYDEMGQILTKELILEKEEFARKYCR